MNCIFCSDIILKSCYFENEYFKVLYNISPIVPGHSLIIPHHHRESFFDSSPMERQELMALLYKTAKFLKKHFNSEGIDVTLQDGACAGQTVMHTHWHLIPRNPKDLASPGSWYHEMIKTFPFSEESDRREKLSDEFLTQCVQDLRQKFALFLAEENDL